MFLSKGHNHSEKLVRRANCKKYGYAVLRTEHFHAGPHLEPARRHGELY